MHNATSQTTLALFCKVVDNFGDIGICWRLARQLTNEHGIAVTLWVDDLASFQKICPSIELERDTQMIDNITVRFWRHQDDIFTIEDIADIVIEFFACDIPPHYITTMAQCEPQPLWLNLEGLTAEEWVEGCHCLPSPHPRLPITKYFFFPGFNDKTGGLLVEQDLQQRRLYFQSNAIYRQEFLQDLGLRPEEITAFTVSLFCYPFAPIKSLFNAWKNSNAAIVCLVPEGVAKEAINTFFGHDIAVGACATRGQLTVRIIPFMPQDDYDKLLWSCDMNFVRGEDSFVRAQMAAKPFIWHIYPQDEQLHHKKLKAFLNVFSDKTDGATSLQNFMLAWNDAQTSDSENPLSRQLSGQLNEQPNGQLSELLRWQLSWQLLWQQWQDELPTIAHQTQKWQDKLCQNIDLASNLLKFAHQKKLEKRFLG